MASASPFPPTTKAVLNVSFNCFAISKEVSNLSSPETLSTLLTPNLESFSSVSFDILDSPPTIYIFLEDRLLPSTLNISDSISDGNESF